MTEGEHDSKRRVNFTTTHWSLVLSAGSTNANSSQTALAWLCQAYWMPLYGYVRRRVTDVHDAQDLTQAFFERMLDRNYLADADPTRGRFRSFLITSFKHFLANEWDKKKTEKRGGGRRVLSLDYEAGESWHTSLPSDDVDAEKLFERQWANTVLTRVMQHLEREQERIGHARRFAALKGFIAGRIHETNIAKVATELTMTEAAARMAVCRLRNRYREMLRAEIAETVASSEEIDDEICHLFAAYLPR